MEVRGSHWVNQVYCCERWLPQLSLWVFNRPSSWTFRIAKALIVYSKDVSNTNATNPDKSIYCKVPRYIITHPYPTSPKNLMPAIASPHSAARPRNTHFPSFSSISSECSKVKQDKRHRYAVPINPTYSFDPFPSQVFGDLSMLCTEQFMHIAHRREFQLAGSELADITPVKVSYVLEGY